MVVEEVEDEVEEEGGGDSKTKRSGLTGSRPTNRRHSSPAARAASAGESAHTAETAGSAGGSDHVSVSQVIACS